MTAKSTRQQQISRSFIYAFTLQCPLETRATFCCIKTFAPICLLIKTKQKNSDPHDVMLKSICRAFWAGGNCGIVYIFFMSKKKDEMKYDVYLWPLDWTHCRNSMQVYWRTSFGHVDTESFLRLSSRNRSSSIRQNGDHLQSSTDSQWD